SLIKAAREAMPLVYGVFFFLLVAAFLEAFWSSSSNLSVETRLWAGGCFWLLSVSYLCLGVAVGLGKSAAKVRSRHPDADPERGAAGGSWRRSLGNWAWGFAVDLGKITAQVRPRNPNEAADLGVVMARQWFWPLLILWVLPSFPLMLVLFILFYDQPWWAAL